MPRRTQQHDTSTLGEDTQPSSLTELQPIVEEFVKKLHVLKLEEEELKDRRKELFDDYSKKLDVKTLKQAIKMVELKKKVDKKDTFDNFVELLDRTE